MTRRRSIWQSEWQSCIVSSMVSGVLLFFYVGVGCPFIIRVENNLSQMRSSPMLSMERIVPLSVSTLSLSLNHQVYSSGPNFMFGKIVKPFYPSNLNSNWKIARGSIVKPEKTIHLKLLAAQVLAQF